MKRIFIVLLALAALCACSQDKKVMARFVPERSDDFVFENNLIAGRFYGKALEGNPTSPGLDIWVKLPGKLVADEWYKGFQTESDAYYHHDHGGKAKRIHNGEAKHIHDNIPTEKQAKASRQTIQPFR